MKKDDLKISYPNSEKVYVSGSIYPNIRVAMRKVTQMPTVVINDGERIENPTSGSGYRYRRSLQHPVYR